MTNFFRSSLCVRWFKRRSSEEVSRLIIHKKLLSPHYCLPNSTIPHLFIKIGSCTHSGDIRSIHSYSSVLSEDCWQILDGSLAQPDKFSSCSINSQCVFLGSVRTVYYYFFWGTHLFQNILFICHRKRVLMSYKGIKMKPIFMHSMWLQKWMNSNPTEYRENTCYYRQL